MNRDEPSWYREALESTERLRSLGRYFLIGCQKSGTTWLQSLCGSHPQLAAGGEGHFSDGLVPLLGAALTKYGEPGNVTTKLNEEDGLAILRFAVERALVQYLPADPSSVRAIGDRTPEASLAIPLLKQLFPEARFVHVIRDGRDGAVSGWAHLKRSGQTERFQSFADYVSYYTSKHWVPYIQLARQAARLWPDDYLEVRYESLHAQASEEARRIFEFLRVDATEETIATCVAASSFDRMSGGRAAGVEDAQSHFRKGVVGDWQRHFDHESLENFRRSARGLAEELGYDVSSEPVAPPQRG